MIFVNYGGGKYWFFDHSKWHGLTVADLVMPWFMFVMGISFSFSLNSMKRKVFSKFEIYKKIIVRSLTLLFLGMWIVNVNLSYSTFRVPGKSWKFSNKFFSPKLTPFFGNWAPKLNDEHHIILKLRNLQSFRNYWTRSLKTLIV